MDWLLKIIKNSLLSAIQGFIDIMFHTLDDVFTFMYEVNQEINYSDVLRYIRAVAIALLICITIKQAISIYALEDSGDSELDPMELIKRMAEGIAVIFGGSWLIGKMLEIAGVAEKELLPKLHEYQIGGFEDTFSNVLGAVKAVSGNGVIWLIVILIMILACYVILMFKAGKRGAELILFELLLPLFACDLITSKRERWNSFFTELCVTIFGYLIQLLCFKVFLFIFGRVLVGSEALNMKYFFAAAAWLILTVSGPKWLKKFTYSSGAGEAIKGGARSAAYLIPNIIKK